MRPEQLGGKRKMVKQKVGNIGKGDKSVRGKKENVRKEGGNVKKGGNVE